MNSMWPVLIIGGLVGVGIAFALGGYLLGVVVVRENEVGIVIKKWSLKSLPAGRLIALDGEAGIQADTLAPGLHLFYWGLQYSVRKVPVTVIQPGQIGLVVAADGRPIPSGRMLGRSIECDRFQDARKFFKNGGEKGRQLGILSSGVYRINTQLFTVITAANADKFSMQPWQLLVYRVDPDMVGIVTTLDGLPIENGEIAGPVVAGHANFQDAQTFLDHEGRRGLQEQVLLSGDWNLNPWFVQVEQVPMVEIPIGYVGVVIAFVGAPAVDLSGEAFMHGDLVEQGHKGVWARPLYPGKHPINTRVMKVELVPTTNIVLNWADRVESHSYDSSLNSITVTSKDGFSFTLTVAQIIHVGALDASRVISRLGSMQNLVDHVMEPLVSNYFRNAAQAYTVLDFLIARQERQQQAAEHVRTALRAYDVQAIDTLIGAIQPPASLMETLTDRKLAEEQRKTYETQQAAQQIRQQLVRETAMADIQKDMVRAEQNVQISELAANARVKEASGEAESIRLRAAGEAEAIRATGEARAESYRQGVDAMGSENYTAIQMMQSIAEKNVRIIPEIMVGGQGGSGSMVEGLLGLLTLERIRAEQSGNGHKTDER